MAKKNYSILVLIFLINLILFVPFFTKAIHKTSCCRLAYQVELDDVDICGPPIGQPAGCDPENAGCCQVQATWTFLENQTIGPIEQGVTQCWLGSSQVNIDIPTPHWGMVCLINTINTVTDVFFWFALSLSVIVGIITGFFFFTAGGEPYKIEKAKSMLIWLVVGIAVAVSAKLITALIMAIVV